jgi:hypothetical protein
LDIEAVVAARDLHTVDDQAVHARGSIVRLELAAACGGTAQGEDAPGVAGDVEAGIFSGRHKEDPAPALPAPANNFTSRREAVAGTLSRLVDGKPGLTVSPACKVLRKGFAGG